MPDTTAALDKWFSSLSPEKRLEILLDRMEHLLTVRRLLAVNGKPGRNGKRARR
jgi:hypothetical protein